MVIDDTIVLRPLAELRPHPAYTTIFGNPREERGYDALRDHVESNLAYMRNALFVVTPDGTIIHGHVYRCIFEDLGVAEATCELTEYKSEFDEVAAVIRYKKAARERLSPEQTAFAYACLREAGARKGFVYFIQSEEGPIKIGFSDDPAKRLDQLQVASPSQLRLLGSLPCKSTREAAIHGYFAEHRLRGEWFRPAPELLAWIAESTDAAAAASR